AQGVLERQRRTLAREQRRRFGERALGVLRLDREDQGIELAARCFGCRYRLEVPPHGALAADAANREPALADRRDVWRARDERNRDTRLGEPAAHERAEPARAEDADPHRHLLSLPAHALR